MGQVYWKQGLPNATFSLFFRSNKKRSYFVFSGIDELLDQIARFRFDDDYLSYLESLKLFDKKYLSYLSTFKFNGLIRSMRNGSLFFPDESVLEVSGNILEGQLLETLIINEIHASTSLATKSSRIVQSSGKSTVFDFSARRTYGYSAALKASKNAYISGFEGTSNVDAGKLFGIPLSGTMGHSYVLSFKNEYLSFVNYAEEFKNNSIFLVDTYDSLKGINNAIDVHKNGSMDVKAIRLDSGDIKELSFKARQMLDAAGLMTTKIIVSGSTTMNMYVLSNAIKSILKPGDEIIVTNQDHEANIGAWRRLASYGFKIKEWKLNPKNAELEIEDLKNLLNKKTKIVAVTHCSNIVGSINDLKLIAEIVPQGGLEPG